jgi:phosphatidylinositol-3-phosphatase
VKRIAPPLGLLLFAVGSTLCSDGCTPQPLPTAAVIPWPAGLPVFDHIVIVVEENKDFEQIIGDARAPYINQILRKDGAVFTQMFGEEHFSEGNYFWLFSGSNQNVGFQDVVPGTPDNPRPFKAPNLGKSLIDKGLSFKGYAEALPSIGSTVEFAKNKFYARKHVPWISFANVPNGTTVADSSNLRFEDFPTDFARLPTVAIVVPNLLNDMHTGEPDDSIPRGDAWLKKNLDAYYQWARKNNSVLIVTWDESDDKSGCVGLTDPFIHPIDQKTKDIRNRIPLIFAGAHIKPGDYAEDKGVTHVNILRTLEAMYGLPRAGAQQSNAAIGGIRDDFIIIDVFERVAR